MRNPSNCKYAHFVYGTYICRGMCAPCGMVENHNCIMEGEYADALKNMAKTINEMKGQKDD